MTGAHFLRRTLLPAAIALLAPIVLSTSAWAASKTHQVTIDKMRFGPMPAGVRAGDTIVWVNRDIVRHTATARGTFDVDLPPKAIGRSKVAKPGTLTVICRYHSGMTARLMVGR
jgi:plastocyanin